MTQFAAKELQTIQSKMNQAFLAKLGVKHIAPLAALYRPAKRGGFGVYNVATKQASSKLQLIVRHVRANSPQGILTLIIY